MKRPYIICHMMTSVDGRIDCAMTEHLSGVQEYYSTLEDLNVPSRVSGKITAQLEMSMAGLYQAESDETLNKESFSKAVSADGYEIVMDTKGTLLWDNYLSQRPLLIVTSENVSCEYLRYLNDNHISWIACGKNKINLKRACEILSEQFGVDRMAIVGGGHINAGFLEAGLLDEVSLLIGAGIDGRAGMTSVLDGLKMEQPVTQLKLIDVKKYSSDAVWLRYKVK